MKKFGLLIISLCVSVLSFGQSVAITDDDTYTASSSSMLDVKSTTKGFLSPRLTTVQRNAIVTPATGLLVFDTSLNGFYYYNGSTWINLSSGSSSGLLWSYNSSNVYLTGASDKVGIGTSTPAHKLMVSDNVTLTDGTDGSFIDIQNQNNTAGVLSGIRFYNGTTVNTYKGGIFYKDVAGFGRGDLILANNSINGSGNVTSTDSRLTIKNTGGVEVKATTGAAANASLFHVLNATGDTIFAVYDGGVRVNVYDDPLVKATSSKGGFAVGGFSPSKGTSTNEYLRITPDSIRMYIEEGIPNKATTSKGGFAVGGFSPSKAIPSDYFNIYGSNTTTTLNPSDPRIFWYPLKEAFLAGRVLVQSPDSVGTNSFATGFESKAIGDYSQALGYSCIARSDYSTAIGKNAVAKSLNSFAFGDNAKALNQDAYAFGAFTEARGIGSFAFGYVGRDTLGPTGHVTKALGNYSFAFGLGSQALDEGAIAFGAEDSAKGRYSVAIGYKNVADSWYATALGYQTRAYWASTSMGYKTNASGMYSTALGFMSNATDESAMAFGYQCDATNRFTIAMGVQAKASSDFSTSIGMQTNATGDNALAMGYMTNATAGFATALGAVNTASGDASTVFGGFNTASGDVSTAMGWNTTAQSMASTVLGRFNVISGTKNSWIDTEPLFILGNGSSTSARSNAITVLKNAKTGIGITTPTHMLHAVDVQASNDNAAVYGEHAITDYYGIGVEGSGKYKGVYGHTSQASGSGYGVQGIASGAGTGTRYGVYGSASGGATAWAGYFSGNVSVTGTLSKGGGSFKIDHPLDPENKYLYHSFVESPDMMNVYNGNVILNNQGKATIELPNYFEVLNKDFRYQLTTIGGFAQVYIEQEVANNQFTIAGGSPGLKVSWQVTGIRKDPFAEQNRIPTEVEKSPEEKGFYLYPAAYGKSVDKSIDKNNVKQ